MSKTIKYDKESKQLMIEGIDKIGNAVKSTLGPKGRHVMIEKSFGSPQVTKDGVTVAKSITLKNKFENMVAQAMIEVSSKTADRAGDGTTTAVLLTQEIAKEALKVTVAGINPTDVKRGIDKGLKAAIDQLKKIAQPCNSPEAIEQVATISANGDKSIGSIIARAAREIDFGTSTITVVDGQSIDHELEMVKGMRFDRGYVSPYLVNQQTMKADFDNAKILIVNKRLTKVSEIVPILEKILKEGSPLLIIAEDIEGEVLSTLAINSVKGLIKVCAVKAPGFGDKRKELLEDIAVLTGATVFESEAGPSLEKYEPEHLGEATNIQVTKDHTTIVGGKGSEQAIHTRIESIKHQSRDKSLSKYETEQLSERISKLTSGIGVIRVGASTEMEMKEIKDRIDDALNAAKHAYFSGVVAGGGVALLKISKSLDHLKGLNQGEDFGIACIRKAMSCPIKQILKNAGRDDYAVIIQKIQENSSDTFGFDANKEEFVDMHKAGILDPLNVTSEALKNAASIACLLITTDVMIAQEEKTNNKNNRDDI